MITTFGNWKTHFVCTLAVVLGLVLCDFSSAQNINVQTPLQRNSSSYFENFGTNFGFSFPGSNGTGSRVVGLGPGGLMNNVTFQNGNQGAIPIFGGFDPNSAARFGITQRNSNGGGFSLGLNLAQGSNRQSITTTPSLTTQNGFGGSLQSGSVSPFVTGVVPIVGSQPGDFVPNYEVINRPYNGVTRALQSGQFIPPQPKDTTYQPSAPLNYSNAASSATKGDLSVSAIKAERQRKMAAKEARLVNKLKEAKEFESKLDFPSAREKYYEAILETDDKKIKSQIKALIKATRQKS